jgi:hypothetical protein
MTSRFHHTAIRQIAVPIWLAALVLAATLTLAATTIFGGDSAEPAGASSPSPITQTTSCLDSGLVGHC